MKVLKYGGLDLDPSKLSESTTVKLPTRNKTNLQESYGEDNYAMPRIEAIHAGRTKNFTHYPAEKLRGDASIKSGVHSWLQPYGKPVIYNHDVETEVTGRVARAAYAEYTQAGRPGIIVVPKITEPNALKALRDGRLLTVSIGATTDAAICSICGTDIVSEGFCGHMKGEQYDGVTAEWIAGNLWFDELSWVNVPADEDAMVTEVDSNILMATEESNKLIDLTKPKKIETLNEYFRIPANITLIEAAGSSSKESEEATQSMGKKETKEHVDEVKETKEVKEDEVKETEVKDAKEVKVEDTKEAGTTEDKAEDKTVTEAEAPQVEQAAPASNQALEHELSEAKDANLSLQAQVEALTAELKEHYKEQILTSLDMDKESLAAFAERIENRTLASLKESLQDIKDGFYAKKAEKKVSEKRVIEKVESPIKTTEQVEKEKSLTESDKISFFKSMLTNK